MTPRRYELTDFEWSIIAPLLPNKPRGVPRADDRKVLNGIYWRLRTGSPWADIPERYGPSTTCYNRFVRWREDRRLGPDIRRGFEGLRRRSANGRQSSSIRVHQHGGQRQKGGSKKRSRRWGRRSKPDAWGARAAD